MPRTRVDVERVREALAVLREFNALDLANVELYENGERLAVPPEAVQEFRFTGLANKDFVDTEFWTEPRSDPRG